MEGLQSRPPTITPNWRSILLAVCFAQATAIVGFDFTLPFVPLYLQHDLGVHGLGATALWAGLIGFGPAIPATIFGPIWGRVADRFGYRVMLLRAMACASLLLALMGRAPSPWVLLVLRMVQGSLTGTVFSSQALVAASVPEKETARSMGLLQMSVYIGATMGPVGGGAVATAFGYRPAFIGAGLLLACATAIVFVFVREPARGRARSSPRESQPRSMLSLLAIPAFLGAVVMTLVVQLAGTSLLPVIPLFVQDLVHSGRDVAADTGWVMATSGLAAAAGSYGAGRLHRHIGLRPLVVISLILSVLLLAPQSMAETYWQFLALRSLAACAYGGLFSLVSTWAAVSSPPESKGASFGLIGAASSLGFGAGPLVGGSLVAALGIRPLFLLAAAVLAIVPAIILGIGSIVGRVTSARRSLAPETVKS